MDGNGEVCKALKMRIFYFKLIFFVYVIDAEARILFLADPQIEGDAKIYKQGKRGEYSYLWLFWLSIQSKGG